MNADLVALEQTRDRRQEQPSCVAVTLAVVTWNSARVLPGLLDSLPAALEGVESHRLVVVDNGSSDATLAVVRELAPTAQVVASSRNGGYAFGLNRAVRSCGSSDAYLFLNPDVRLGEGAVGRLLRTSQESGTGIVVPRLVDESGRLLPSLRRDPNLLRALGEAVLGGRRAGRYRWLGEMVTTPSAYEQECSVDWASGAAMLVTAGCLERVGLMDESFFLYSEETDFAMRTRDEGLEVRYCPSAHAVHVGGEVHTSAFLYTVLVQNRLRLYARRHGPVAAGAFRSALVLGEALRSREKLHRQALRALLSPVGAEAQHGRAEGP